jgi:isoquinoline 1-oxidoreductase beta subunit
MKRREFVASGLAVTAGLTGGLTLSISGCSSGERRPGALQKLDFNAWLTIGTDESIRFFCDRSEMGQGVYTSLPMLIAEELGVKLERIAVEFAPVGPAYVNALLGGQLTGGSTSVRDAWAPQPARNGTSLRRAAASKTASSFRHAARD